MKKILIFCCILQLSACNYSPDFTYIRSTGWSYSDGYRVADFMNFTIAGGYSIKNDTIFFGGQPQATIVLLDKERNDLTIRSLDGKQVGYYRDEREAIR